MVIPPGGGQEFLEGPHRRTGFQGDRLDTLAEQVAQQAAAVGAQVLKGRKTREEPAEATEKLGECRPQAGDLLFGHRPPCLMEVLPHQKHPR